MFNPLVIDREIDEDPAFQDNEIDSEGNYISSDQPINENNYTIVTYGSENQEYNPFEKSLTSSIESNGKVYTQMQSITSTPSFDTSERVHNEDNIAFYSNQIQSFPIYSDHTPPFNQAIHNTQTSIYQVPHYQIPNYQMPYYQMPNYQMPNYQMPHYKIPNVQMLNVQRLVHLI